jgi:hypothetical protein
MKVVLFDEVGADRLTSRCRRGSLARSLRLRRRWHRASG